MGVSSCSSNISFSVSREWNDDVLHIQVKKEDQQCETVRVDFSSIPASAYCLRRLIDSNVNSMIVDLMQTGKTQRREFTLGGDFGVLKVRRVGTEIQVLLKQFLEAGKTKRVFKCFLLGGPPLPNQPPRNIFCYAKFPELKKIRAQIKEIDNTIQAFCAANKSPQEIEPLHKQKQEAQDRYAQIVGDLFKEVEISHLVHDAVKSEVVRHFKDPASPKGLIMEFVDSIPQDEIYPSDREEGARDLKLHIELALRLCQALHQVNQAGYVHMDFRKDNILFVKQGESIGIKLIDFGSSVKIGTSVTGGATIYQFLPELINVDPKEFPKAASVMDAFALAFVIVELVYGSKALVLDDNGKVVLLRDDIWRLYQVNEKMRHCLCLERDPWKELKFLVKRRLGTYPPIDKIICHLWDQATKRLTAGDAAMAFQQILDS